MDVEETVRELMVKQPSARQIRRLLEVVEDELTAAVERYNRLHEIKDALAKLAVTYN